MNENINIYSDNKLKYSLNDKEYKIIDKVWTFINYFAFDTIYVTDYRNNIINSIRNNYTIDEFFLYESIANKLFWNMRWIIYPLFMDINIDTKSYNSLIHNSLEIPASLLLHDVIKYTNDNDLKNVLIEFKNTIYYRSFINKLFIVDELNNIVYKKLQEGSSDIFAKNYFNLVSSTIMLDRNTYESIMRDPWQLQKIALSLPEFYYQHDYAYPNINYSTYNFCTDDEKMNRIRKMYFMDTIIDCEKNWFKIIKNEMSNN